MKRLSAKTVEVETEDAKGASTATLLQKLKGEVGDAATVITRTDSDGAFETTQGNKKVKVRIFVTTDPGDDVIPSRTRARNAELEDSVQSIVQAVLK